MPPAEYIVSPLNVKVLFWNGLHIAAHCTRDALPDDVKVPLERRETTDRQAVLRRPENYFKR
ncbi:MAG: hypothetical protein OJF47_003317 [Nitrospira sp.]|jgi:hypothetical protein|nr:MAG: hypothetical protein OJF47_003317 [Nitrospira sp.]